MNQYKIHESPIVDFKIPSKFSNHKHSIITGNYQINSKSLIYSLDKNATIKTFDLYSGEIFKNFKLIKEANYKILFDVDYDEKYLVFSKGTKIRLLSLDNIAKNNFNVKSNTTKIGMHSQEIINLKFSSDGKFILSSTLRDYIISVWHLKNKDTPLFTFQNSFLPLDNFMIKINKGIYHAISVSRENISVFKIDLKEIDPNEPLKAAFLAEFPQKNLVGISYHDIISKEKKDFIDYNDLENKNNDKIISAFYGNLLKLERKNICYSEKSNKEDVKRAEIKILIDEKALNNENRNKSNKNDNIKNVVVNSNKFKILNEIDMSKNEIVNEAENRNLKKSQNQGLLIIDNKNSKNQNNELANSDTKISLINIIRNSLINNDINQFEWALDQKVKLS